MNQIQECSYIINEYREEYFTVFGAKYDYRMAICVGDFALKNLQEFPAFSPKAPKCMLSYRDRSKLDTHLKDLTPYSKLTLLGHGGLHALREKSSSEAPAIKPDFSWKNAADLLALSAPQLLDPVDEIPSTLFKISLVSCQALKYGLDLSQGLAKRGISNRITARAFNVYYDSDGRKLTLWGQKYLNKRTGSKILFTTYSQYPGLSQVEIVDYEQDRSDGFVLVPSSEKPIQNWKIHNHSTESYEAILHVIKMLGCEKIPFYALCEAVANQASSCALEMLSKYFTAMLSDSDYLEQLVEYVVTKGVDSNGLLTFFKTCVLSVPGEPNSWVRFAIRHRVPPTILNILLSKLYEKQTKQKELFYTYSLLSSNTLIYTLEQEANEVLTTILPYFSSEQTACTVELATEKGCSEEILNKLLTSKKEIRLNYRILSRIPNSPTTLALQKLLIPYIYDFPQSCLRSLPSKKNHELRALISRRIAQLKKREITITTSKRSSKNLYF